MRGNGGGQKSADAYTAYHSVSIEKWRPQNGNGQKRRWRRARNLERCLFGLLGVDRPFGRLRLARPPLLGEILTNVFARERVGFGMRMRTAAVVTVGPFVP